MIPHRHSLGLGVFILLTAVRAFAAEDGAGLVLAESSVLVQASGGFGLGGQEETLRVSDDLFRGRKRRSDSGAEEAYEGSSDFSTAGFTKEPGEPDHGGEKGGASAWLSFRASEEGVMLFNTAGTGFPHAVAVYTGPENAKSFADLKLVKATEGAGDAAEIKFETEPGQIFHIALDGKDGASGTVRLAYKLGFSKIVNFAMDPKNPVKKGAAVTLSAEAFELRSQGLSFQWRKNGAPIEGATSANLSLPEGTVGDGDQYSVVVSNYGSGGFAASDARPPMVMEGNFGAFQPDAAVMNRLAQLGLTPPGSPESAQLFSDATAQASVVQPASIPEPTAPCLAGLAGLLFWGSTGWRRRRG